MKAGVDNAAQAYVNGVFKQEFEWSKGDFVLTDKAQPGEVITVALHAINRPGSGSLLRASAGEWFRRGAGGGPARAGEGYRGKPGGWGLRAGGGGSPCAGVVREALQALDTAVYQACNRDAFLASVEKARAILLSDRATVEERLKKTAENLEALKQKIRQGREAGRPDGVSGRRCARRGELSALRA